MSFKDLGLRIRGVRQQLGLTQRAFADKIPEPTKAYTKETLNQDIKKARSDIRYTEGSIALLKERLEKQRSKLVALEKELVDINKPKPPPVSKKKPKAK